MRVTHSVYGLAALGASTVVAQVPALAPPPAGAGAAANPLASLPAAAAAAAAPKAPAAGTPGAPANPLAGLLAGLQGPKAGGAPAAPGAAGANPLAGLLAGFQGPKAGGAKGAPGALGANPFAGLFGAPGPNPLEGLLQGLQSNTQLMEAVTNFTGIVTTKDGIDISASVCETFKPGKPLGQLLSPMFGSPYYGGQPCVKDTSGGSGPYKAGYTTDPTLKDHTIYAPKTPPPANVKLPVLIWGNGACLAVGTMFQNFLTEIASHGFFVIANGQPVTLGVTTYRDLLASIDWVTTNPAVQKYGNVDISNLAIAGQSCGGNEAYQASLNTNKSKLTILFNSGYLADIQSPDIKKINTPVAYFLGGKTDIATAKGTRDFHALKPGVPALLADADTGHIGTYYQMGGGLNGKAAVAFLKWKMKGDQSLKPLFCNPAKDSELVKAGWNITTKDGMC